MHMPGFKVEHDLRKQGYRWVAGLDEAGRGSWAGPLYAAAVILPLSAEGASTVQLLHNEGVRDGKRISPKRRESLCELVEELALTYGVGVASAGEVDAWGLTRATQLAMERALANLTRRPDYLLIDGKYLKLPGVDLPQEGLPYGEWKARSIAAASIVAKVERDRRMRELDEAHPGYGFAQHKGYGTEAHRKALKKLGPCPEHRRSFKPIATLSGVAR